MTPSSAADRPYRERVAAATTQVRNNTVAELVLLGGFSLLMGAGVVPRGAWPTLPLTGVLMVLERWFLRRVQRQQPHQAVARIMVVYGILLMTAAIHLLGELGSAVGIGLYFLQLTPAMERRFSGFTLFHLANLASAAFAGLRFAEAGGLLAPVHYWPGSAMPIGAQVGAVVSLWVILNGAAVLARRVERALAERAAALLESNTTLEQRNLELQRLQHEFECYASGVAHDLANPIAAAMEGFSTLRDLLPGQDAPTHDLVLMTERSMGRALEMLGGLREITKTVAAEEQFVPVRMDEVVAEVVGEFDLGLRAKAIRLLLPSPLPVLSLQRAKMVQVWRNLLGNAIKYVAAAREPEIRVAYRLTSAGHTFSVSDNGVGIPAAFRARIFDPFERVPDDQTIPSRGMGLGLTLVKRVIERHGGAITVESEAGRGTTFQFTLPVREGLEQAA